MIGNETADSELGLDPAGLFQAAPEALFVLRAERIVLVNERMILLLGWDPTGMYVREAFPDWHAPATDQTPFDSTLRMEQGHDLPVQVRIRQVAEDSYAIVAVRDARALLAGREAEVRLSEAEARYRSLVEQIPAVVYADDGTVTTYVSPQIRQILGVTPDEYRDDPRMWMRMVHPDDRAMVQAESDAFLRGEGGDLSDYRMVRPDGRIVWIRNRAFAFRDEQGHVLWEHGLLFDVTQLKDAEARISHMAYHDGLTGLANRLLFEETMALAVERAKREHTQVAVLFLDVDNFKLVNDSLGHHAGDDLLRQLAERLKTCTRDTDLVARQGGDEFLILLADLEQDGAEGAIRLVAGRVNEVLREPFDLSGVEFHARGSTGISVFPRDAGDVDSLLKNADVAMYRAKRLEPGGYLFFAGESDDALARLSFASRLRKAVEDQNWVLHYQPVVDLSDRRIVGAEALIRWQDATGGLVPPGEFIPAAEELGLIEAIGDWVIDQVARQQRAWRGEGIELELSFNLSPRQLWTSRLAERMRDRLAEAGVEPSTLVAEVTESTAMTDPDRTHRVLSDLHSWGMRLAIDDFGTGYSSLSRLKHMPVDVLKIDREFIRNVDKDVRLAGMVRAMIQVAQSLDMIPLAEGIETEAEYVFLRSNGCRLAQGFWFAYPMPAEELRDLVVDAKPLGSPTPFA